MEEAGLGGGAVAALVVAGPVARIARVRIAAITVFGHHRIADEVVARQDSAGEIGVRRDAGVDHRDRDAGAADLQVPRRGGIDPARAGRERPLLAEKRIVRNAGWKDAARRIGVLHRGVDLQLLGHAGQQVFGHRFGEREHPDAADLTLDRQR